MHPSLLLVALLSLAWSTVSAAADGSAAALPAKPNLVLILIDDLGYGDVAPFGSKLNRTPNLDRMAAEGMKLTSFYACPVCTPSRAQFMTGCYAKRVSLPNVIFPAAAVGLNPSEATVAGLLKKQGYATMCIGKWHLGDQPEFLPTRHGFDHYLGLPYSNDMGGTGRAADGAKGEGKAEEKPDAKAAEKKAVRRPYPPLPLLRDETVIETVDAAGQSHLTERYTDEAVKFIRGHKDAPFFLYLPHTGVHVPLHPGTAFKGKSANGTYGDWVEELDASVGRVLETLRELKLDSKTLVLFTSDNGPWLTQGKNGGMAGPLKGGKGSTWEGGMREPTIAWWPGHIAPGSSCDAVTANLDVLPTFVKLGGGAVPTDRKIDGKDIWPLLSGAAKESPHEAFYYFQGTKLEAVRAGAWKLRLSGAGRGTATKDEKKSAPLTEPQLYNLVEDIGETTDVAAGNPDVVKRLSALADQMDADLGRNAKGPGVREPGRSTDPKPLLLKDDK